MNKSHKHLINAVTGICRNCGLSVAQKLTTECPAQYVEPIIIKSILTNQLDFKNGMWIDIGTAKIEKSPEPEERATVLELMHFLFSASQLPDEDEELSDLVTRTNAAGDEVSLDTDEFPFLVAIAAFPLPSDLVRDLALPIDTVSSLIKFKKHGLISNTFNEYCISKFGESFLTEPEEETKPELLSVSELSSLFAYVYKPRNVQEIAADPEAWAQCKKLENRGLLVIHSKIVRLTSTALNHLDKLCNIPL